MTQIKKFSCYLIGSQALLMRCAEHLLAKGYEVRGVISDSTDVGQWAVGQDVHFIDADSDIVAAMSSKPFDYLFSIFNFIVLPDAMLSLPVKGAINYHGGPLPEYAGMNMPTWALINREKEHAVTWHLMTAELDKGDILAETRFPIEADDTAFTLNARCYEIGLSSFIDLVDSLADGTAEPSAQDLSKHYYYSSHRRPPANGIINWRKDAEDIDALVRALDFGPSWNAVGTAKLFTGTQAYLINDIEILPVNSDVSTGAIVDVGENITVATATFDIRITRLCNFAGIAVSGSDVIRDCKLKVGDVLPLLNDGDMGVLAQMDSTSSKFEPHWIKVLNSLEPLELPYANRSTDKKALGCQNYAVPDGAISSLASDIRGDTLLACVSLYFSRISGKDTYDVALADRRGVSSAAADILFQLSVPLRTCIGYGQSVNNFCSGFNQQLDSAYEHPYFPRDLVSRIPYLAENAARLVSQQLSISLVRVNDVTHDDIPLDGDLILVIPDNAKNCLWHYNPAVYNDYAISVMQEQLTVMIAAMIADPGQPIETLPIMPLEERNKLLKQWNDTYYDYDKSVCIHQLFEKSVESNPEAPALTFHGLTLSYTELNEQANRVAHYLLAQGAQPDGLVGVLVDRSIEMIVAMFGVLKAGAAYLPLDPDYPADRIGYMIDDSDVQIIITQSKHSSFVEGDDIPVLFIDADIGLLKQQPSSNPDTTVQSQHLAYTMYTSGSTGKPKGVMVEHRNVNNFFTGMDQCVERGKTNTWLAVTSISFDISVLEIFWTLARGFHVILFSDDERTSAKKLRTRFPAQDMEFSLFYWNVASDESEQDTDKYRLLIESAKYGDKNGFKALWTPERHFQSFGGLYPNPSLISAALATITEHIELRAGSCVAPLHSPIRIAEEWAVVDNLSNGRVGISVAAGWQPNDFVIKPENFADAKNIMFESVDTVRRLWRGESIDFDNPQGDGTIKVSILPRPIQQELPIWVTAAGNPDTFKQAAKIGANILTHLLGQSAEDLADKIKLYRDAWKEAGHPGEGHITLLLHTLVGDDEEIVREMAREPMKNYLKSAVFLIKAAAWHSPTWKTLSKKSEQTIDQWFDTVSDDDMDVLLDFAFDRYYETSGLFGTPARCLERVDQLKEAGVNEIGCLIDFGANTDLVLNQLPFLNQVREIGSCQDMSAADDVNNLDMPDLIERYQVTHLQCTPSQASMLVADEAMNKNLKQLRHLMVGGEAFPSPLAEKLKSLVGGRVTNMYGPTEVTIWATTQDISGESSIIPIGRPIANTQVYVLDKYLQPVPYGVPGELFLGGDGVVRGYYKRTQLTSERFLQDPFVKKSDACMYRTGDLVRYSENGVLEFLGRTDDQVKFHGYRIELGEVENCLLQQEKVTEAAVILREDKVGDKRLVAYVCHSGAGNAYEATLKRFMQLTLPEFMIPGVFVNLDSMPLTPNGKIDRLALPVPEASRNQTAPRSIVSAKSKLQEQILEIWKSVLNVDNIGVEDNFFDVGGHSLLVIEVLFELRDTLKLQLKMTDIFRYPTIGQLSKNIESGAESDTLQQSQSRGLARREARKNLIKKRSRKA